MGGRGKKVLSSLKEAFVLCVQNKMITSYSPTAEVEETISSHVSKPRNLAEESAVRFRSLNLEFVDNIEQWFM